MIDKSIDTNSSNTRVNASSQNVIHYSSRVSNLVRCNLNDTTEPTAFFWNNARLRFLTRGDSAIGCLAFMSLRGRNTQGGDFHTTVVGR
jgi:hypothetical protein